MAFDEAAALDSLWDARLRGDFFPDAWIGRLTVDQAYRVQLGILARRSAMGARRIGWKVALTSKPTQQQFNFHEPAFGHVLEQFSTGHRFPADMIRPGCEPEICVRLARLVSRRDWRARRRTSLPRSKCLALAMGRTGKRWMSICRSLGCLPVCLVPRHAWPGTPGRRRLRPRPRRHG